MTRFKIYKNKKIRVLEIERERDLLKITIRKSGNHFSSMAIRCPVFVTGFSYLNSGLLLHRNLFERIVRMDLKFVRDFNTFLGPYLRSLKAKTEIIK